jgi:hypothetical protein
VFGLVWGHYSRDCCITILMQISGGVNMQSKALLKWWTLWGSELIDNSFSTTNPYKCHGIIWYGQILLMRLRCKCIPASHRGLDKSVF